MDTPDKLVDADTIVAGCDYGDCADAAEWIVRLELRDNDCRFYYVDTNGNVNARLSSALKLTKEDAKQFAKAVSERHPKYKARAFLFRTLKKQKEAAK